MILITVLIAVIVVLDQLSKSYAVYHLPMHTSVNVLDPIFHFHYNENRGAAWNILEDHPWVFMVFSSVAIVAILVFLFINRKKALHPVLRFGLAFIVGGGIGNMIDRIAKGFVVDFIEFGFIDFPIFNVADSFITIGSFSIIIYLIIDLIKELSNKKKNTMPDIEALDEASNENAETEDKDTDINSGNSDEETEKKNDEESV